MTPAPKTLTRVLLESMINDEILIGMTEELDDPNSEISKLVDSVITHAVLTTLDQAHRLELYRLAETGDQTLLKNFVHQQIPNLESKVAAKINLIFERTIKTTV